MYCTTTGETKLQINLKLWLLTSGQPLSLSNIKYFHQLLHFFRNTAPNFKDRI